MLGRHPLGQRTRSGLTLVELLVAIAALGLLEALLLTTRAPAPTPLQPRPLAPPCPAPLVPTRGEISLQATLDRLGFTVNVPREYQGLRLQNRGPGHVSTRSDAVPAEWFAADGLVQCLEVSRQSSLGSATSFAALTAAGTEISVLPRPESTGAYSMPPPVRTIVYGTPPRVTTMRFRSGAPAYRLTLDEPAAREPTPRRANFETHGQLRFSIQFPPNPFNRGAFFSTAADNPDGVPHLLVLPGRKGGTWVEECGNTGHWEGGAEDGTYLLCWEDELRGDNDFQDLVIYTAGLRPERR